MDGSGGYTKITEAVIEVPNWTTEGEKWVILVREGVYKENVELDGFIACNLAVVNTTDRTKHHVVALLILEAQYLSLSGHPLHPLHSPVL
ncbi:hypothetical protein AMTR_s00076p00183040 [Amborella trichopoda]|uniref:Pectinesterase catalytic domain-containing protein n=1 Tax=Amborella trichopoda TaxID=13333 RepID=W1PAU9_AMBTC|nr:hypothetical protein AMTR_s00076p00183040 [Amborella trichopoda]